MVKCKRKKCVLEKERKEEIMCECKLKRKVDEIYNSSIHRIEIYECLNCNKIHKKDRYLKYENGLLVNI